MPDSKMLNDAQRRNLTVTLRVLEQSLDDIAALLDQSVVHDGALYHVRNNLPPGSAEQFQTQAQVIREQIARLAEQFGFVADERTTCAISAAKLNYCWEVLQEADSRGLLAYGQVASGLDLTLDPAVKVLSEKVLGLLQLFERQPKE